MSKKKKRKSSKKSPKPRGCQFRHYLVAFLDILGQKSKLRNMKSLPANSEEHQNFVETVNETLAPVFLLRDIFPKYFKAFSTQRAIPNGLSPENRQLYLDISRGAKKMLPHVTSFSDTVLISVPLAHDKGEVYFDGIFSSLLSLPGAFIAMLRSNYVFRGGVDIGVATELSSNEIYGPALLKAYELESRIAKYPRVIVGEELANFIFEVSDSKAPDIKSQIRQQLAIACKNLIIKDFDGHYVIHYLGDYYRKFAGQIVGVFLPDAKSFIDKRLNEFEKSGDTKLTDKYKYISKYFGRWLPRWKNEMQDDVYE